MKKFLVIILSIIAFFSVVYQPLYAVPFPQRKSLNEQLVEAAATSQPVQKSVSLLKAGAFVNSRDSEGRTPLFFAAKTGNIPLMQLLLESGADKDLASTRGITPLYMSIDSSPEAARLLIKAGASVEKPDNDGDTPLHIAAYKGENAIAEELIAGGATVNARNHKDETPLDWAAWANKQNSVELLLNSGANLNRFSYHYKIGTLGFAALNGNLDVLKTILKHGISLIDSPVLSGEEKPGGYPLSAIFASGSGQHHEVLKFLLQQLGFYVRKLCTSPDTDTFQQNQQQAQEFSGVLNRLIVLYSTRLNEENTQKINRILETLSRRCRLQSLRPVEKPAQELITIQDISVVDTQTTVSPNTVLPFVAPGSKNLTQTESYLSVPILKNRVIQDFGLELAQFPMLINRIINQEKQFKDYDVFYHGQKRDFIMLYDVIRFIQNWINNVKDTPEFEYIRYPEGQNEKLSTLIEMGDIIYDHAARFVKNLLPVNFSLFGNTRTIGESTLAYFINNHNENPPQRLLESLFDNLGLNKDYIPQLVALLSLVESPTGNLLQIFIPSHLVNKYVYLSTAYGKTLAGAPRDTEQYVYFPLVPVHLQDPKTGKKVTLKLEEITTEDYIKIYRTNPEALNPLDMDGIQGRINITQDFLLNPKSGVKIFRYNTVHPDKLLEYQEKLKTLMTQVMTEWEKNQSEKQKGSWLEELFDAVDKLFPFEHWPV